MYAYMYVYMYVHMYVHVYVRVYTIHMHVYICMYNMYNISIFNIFTWEKKIIQFVINFVINFIFYNTSTLCIQELCELLNSSHFT